MPVQPQYNPHVRPQNPYVRPPQYNPYPQQPQQPYYPVPQRPRWPRRGTMSITKMASYLPQAMRVKNWASSKDGSGSCVFASLLMCANKQGRYDVSTAIRQAYEGGEHSSRLARRLDALNLPFAMVLNGDAEFLEICSRTRRGAMIGYGVAHAQYFDRFEVRNGQKYAIVIDNNFPNTEQVIPYNKFLRNWRGTGDGWATTLVLPGGGMPNLLPQ